MPRKSLYRIALSPDEEIELLKRSSKYTLPYFTVLRATMILLAALKEHILGFQQYYEGIAKPFEWKFTRKDFNRLMCRINCKQVDSYRLAA